MPVHIVNETPLALGFTAGRVRRTGMHLTTIVKGAFRLVPGAPAAVSERPLLDGDSHWEDDLAQSCRGASDFAPWKPKADVTITGTCHVASGRPEGTARVTARVGPMRKVLAVFGDRHFVEQPLGGHAISAPVPFRSMPLRWERAFGGPGFAANPVGKGWATALGPRSRPLPNLELAGALIRYPGDSPEPASLGPIDRRWAPRTAKLGTYGERWLAERWPDLPDDVDWGYFNAAPEDQQVPYLRGDEPVVLEGMFTDAARLESHLPGLRPRCFLRRTQLADGAPEEVALHLDTVTIDADAGTLILVWRGLAPVRSRDFAEIEGALLVVEAMVDAPRPASHYHAAAHWTPAAPDQAALAEADEAAARGAAAPPPPPVPEPEDLAEKAELDEARADLAAAGADPALLQRLEGVTRSAVFTAILMEHIEKETPKEKENAEDEPAAKPPTELDRMRGELAAAGADPALLARLAAVTTTSRFLEVLLAEMPPGDTPAAKKERSDLVDAVRAMDAQAEAVALEPEASRRAARGDRLTRAEVEAILATGGGLAEANLTGLDLTGLALRGVSLAGAKLDGAKLIGVDLGGADLTGASLRLAELGRASLVEAVVEGADLEGARLGRADLARAQLGKANLSSAQLQEARLDDADLTAARLPLATLDGASLDGVLLEGADLERATLRGAHGARVKLRGAKLDHADLTGAKLDGAVLSGCSLDAAQLVGVSLRDAHLDGASGDGATFRGADLTGVRAAEARLTNGCLDEVIAPGSTWTGADLTGSTFEGATLTDALFTGAVLVTAGFDRARLEQADLSKAALTRARLTRANLFRARLGGADLTDADCRGSNLFECDLFEAIALRTRFERSNLKRTCLERGLA